MTAPERNAAAFIRVEGVLFKRGLLSAAAYVARNAQGMKERALRTVGLALGAPAYGLLRQNDRTLANRVAYLAFRGMSQDRIEVLGEEYFHDVLASKLLDRGVEIVQRMKDEGYRTVLLSESLPQLMAPLVDKIGARHVDRLVTNHIEFKADGDCTGRLLDPVVGGHDAGRFVHRYCEEHGLDARGSAAFGSHAGDLLLLASVGKPCAVNPDFTLRRAAHEADWPIVDYTEDA